MIPKLHLNVVNHTHVGFSADVFYRHAENVMINAADQRLEQFAEISLDVVLVDDEKIQELNKAYRQKDCPTDVLSFSFLEDTENVPTPSEYGGIFEIGEIMVSIDTARKQAEQYGHDLEQEIKILIVHGLLHILGYDHEKPDDFEVMKQQEQNVLGDKAGLIQRSTVDAN